MAENVVINIEANTAGLTETINLLTKLGVVEKSVAEEFQKTNAANVASIQKGVQSTTKEFEKLDKAVKGIKSDNGLAKALDVSKEVTQVGNSFQSLRAQLKEATAEAQQLAVQFGELDPKTLAAANRASELRQAIEDTDRVIKALDPGEKFNTISKVGASIAGVFQVATGSLQAFGVESEQATKIAQQFQGALNIFAGLQQLGELKDTLTAVKAAFTVTTVATDGAKTAQLGLNAAVLANPYVIAAAALVALTAAVVAFTDDSEEAAEAQKKLNSELNTLNAGNQAYIAQLDRSTKQRLSDLDTEIKLLELQGGKTKEIGDLRLKKIDVEQKGLQLLLESNNKLNQAEEEKYNKLKDLRTTESLAQAKTILDEIFARRAANKDIESQIYILNNTRRQQEAETTAQIKKEEEARVKAAQEAASKQAKTKVVLPPIEPPTTLTGKGIEVKVTATGVKEAKQGLAELSQEFQDGVKRGEDYIKMVEENEAKLKELKETVVFEGVGAGLDVLFANINANLEDQVRTAEDTKNAQLDIIKEEEDALLNSYEQRRIGKRQLEEEQKRLALERIGAEKRAERELAELKRKQDISTRVQALFDIAVNTAKNVVSQPGLGGTLIPYWIALGAIQSAAVLAKPLPKYKKGTLSVGGVGSDDSQLALLQPGEAVIPTDTNRKYHPAIKAIYQNKIRPEDINAFVKMRLRGDVTERNAMPVAAKIETSDLYALGRIMKKNNGVHVTNMGDLAQVLASINNLRR